MKFNAKTHQDKLLFIPLGGSNEIGLNLNVYKFGDKYLIIDCGSGFADDYLPGVDIIVPDIRFLEEHKKDILAVILTHAHEDHLGAIQYLWNSLECPIYATRFTKNFLKIKLSEYSFANKIVINEVSPGQIFNVGPFSLEMTPLTHSAPEMQAIMIRTPAGNVLHTGDWKFDPSPVVGTVSDEDRLRAYAEEGVLALVCDSTNVFNPGTSGSEGEVRKNLVDIIAGCPKMVVVTTFASNLARLDTIIHAGEQAGRKIVLTGRSLHRIFSAAQDSGYLKDVAPLVDERSIGKYKRNELLIIATGCQGEPMAAVSKMVNDVHPTLKLAKEDTVIFSSKIIPGNDKKIFSLFNKFVKKGIEVITERDHFVHVSGHPSIDELKKMYDLVKPQIVIPVHGEAVHIHEQAKLARKQGIKHAVEVENGSVVLLDEVAPKVIGKVETGYLAVDGNYLLPSTSGVFKMRRNMRDSGIAVISVAVDKKGYLAAKPMVSLPGLLDAKEDFELVDDIRAVITRSLNDQAKKEKGIILHDQIESCIKSTIKRILKGEINKSPVILINVETIVS